MPSVYGCDRPKARKDHKCYECRGVISKGETYHKHHGIWDGSAYTYKVCDECETLRAKIDSTIEDYEERVSFGDLYEFVFEGEDIECVNAFLDTKRKRLAEIPEWMLERQLEIAARKENKQ